jgi:hypothetical protein
MPGQSKISIISVKYGKPAWALAYLTARGTAGEDVGLMATAFYDGDATHMHGHLVARGLARVEGCKIWATGADTKVPTTTQMFDMYIWLKTEDGVWYKRTQLEGLMRVAFPGADGVRNKSHFLHNKHIRNMSKETAGKNPLIFMFK